MLKIFISHTVVDMRDLVAEKMGTNARTHIVGNHALTMACLSHNVYDLVILQNSLIQPNVAEAIEKARRRNPDCIVLVVSGGMNSTMAENAIKAGANLAFPTHDLLAEIDKLTFAVSEA